MVNVQPGTYLNGFSHLSAGAPAPSQGIFIPLATFPNLTGADIDPINGDIRKLMYDLNRSIFNSLNSFEDPGQKPLKFNITRATPVGVNATTIRQSYTTSFDLAITDVDVAAE